MTVMAPPKIKVLIVDDSAVTRQVLERALAVDPAIEIVGKAGNPYVATEMIQQLQPHVMTLDVDMPRMDGITFLAKLMPQYPMPVIMVSSYTHEGGTLTLKALQLGAVDFVTKPASGDPGALESMIGELIAKIKIAALVDVRSLQFATKTRPPALCSRPEPAVLPVLHGGKRIIAIGASTGGTEAIRLLVAGLGRHVPGVVVVQHMPPGFTALYAQDLNQLTDLEVIEARTGEIVKPGKVIIARGGDHLRVRPTLRGGFDVECFRGERVNGHCPSVDVLFGSVAREAGKFAVGVLLTGMGRDGAEGLAAMRAAGAHTLAQDEASCVVFGMPKAAIELGAAAQVLPLNEIADVLAGIKATHPPTND